LAAASIPARLASVALASSVDRRWQAVGLPDAAVAFHPTQRDWYRRRFWLHAQG
jgi:hypothetical protein